MRLLSCTLLLLSTLLIISTVRCDDEAAAPPTKDASDAVAPDGTCDKDGLCGDDEPAQDADAEEEIIAEEDEEEAKEEETKLPVTSCICTGIEEQPEVGVEKLFEPETCGRRSPANNQDVVTLHLRGWKESDPEDVFITTYLEDGEEGQSVFFPMGVGSGIKGLELGVVGMCVGEKRRITIPPKLVRHGRNEFEGDKIPRDETLIFEVELIGAYPHYQAGMPNMFARMDKDKDGIVSWQEAHDYMVIDGAFPDGPDSVIPRLTTEWIAKTDKDKDNQLSWKEFPLPKYSEL